MSIIPNLDEGMISEAIAELQNPNYPALLGYAYAVSGNQAKAQKILDDLKEKSKDKYVPSFQFADIYTGLGDKDKAIEWLEKAYEERTITSYILMHPCYDPLRSDPRFKALLKKMGMKAIKQ